jgi:hypothetical protein
LLDIDIDIDIDIDKEAETSFMPPGQGSRHAPLSTPRADP